ncbi:MAG: cupin domain-containing protein [Proteobacteria bacterium]|nr:cupin domain-containing protein [Pseudomonadota bacterium]MBU1610524.1 cupin domain-containing protein [Pseudomonadota bacterium]
MSIIIVNNPGQDVLEGLGVFSWSIWEHEAAVFPWTYDSEEICYLLEGQVEVVPDDGTPALSFGAGDLVTFPAGLSCTWKILRSVRKHYRFSSDTA